MGWLFGWYTRESLIDHLCTGNGVETLKRKFVGNNMWAVQRTKEGITFACLYLIKGNPRVQDDPYNWGYKDVDETMGPCDTDFPEAWLDLLSPIDSKYALEWRQAVRDRAARDRRIKIGTKWKYGGHIYEVIARRSPTSFRAKDEFGDTWRVKLSQLRHAEEVKQ